jgi:hypothetical protein
MGVPLDLLYDFGHLRPETDPVMVLPALAVEREPRITRLQFDQPLPEALLRSAAEALEQYPDVALRAYGREVDPSLTWLARFSRLRRLWVELYEATSFAPIGELGELRCLNLGSTRSAKPSLDVVARLPQLRELGIDGHGAKGFEAIANLEELERLHVRAPRQRRWDALAHHATLRELSIAFGGLRDLAPLATLPALDTLSLVEVRKLDGRDLEALAPSAALRTLMLQSLRQVRDLRFLGTARFAAGLETLGLDRLGPLEDLSPLTACTNLKRLRIVDARPADRDLSPLATLTSLREVFLGNPYPRAQLDLLRDVLGPGVVNDQGKVMN